MVPTHPHLKPDSLDSPRVDVTKQIVGSLSGKSLHILVPMYGGNATGNFVESFARLSLKLQRLGVDFTYTFVYNESLVSRARNRLADSYTKTSTRTHALYIDADIGFDPDDIIAMLVADKDVLGAVCAKKVIRWDRVQAAIKGHPEREFTKDEMLQLSGDCVFNLDPFSGVKSFDTRELQRVKSIGTGILMVRRNVFTEFREHYPDRWYETPEDLQSLPGPTHDYFKVGINPDNRKYESEDFWFCLDVAAMGKEIWMMPWTKTNHMGSFVYSANLPAISKVIPNMGR